MADTIDTGVGVRALSGNTPGLAARQLDFSEIPLLDFSPMRAGAAADKQKLARQLFDVCTQVGFFYITDHGVSDAAIRNLQAASSAFFNQPLEAKLAVDVKHSSFNRGYIPMYGEKNNEHSKGDIKETFDAAIEIAEDDSDYIAGNPLYGPNQWPMELPRFKAAMQQYFDEMSDLSKRLYSAFALALDLPENHFDAMRQKPLDILRLLR